MAQLPPEDIATMPAQKVVFNGPGHEAVTLRVYNDGTRCIGVRISTKGRHLHTSPKTAVLRGKELLAVFIYWEGEQFGDTKDRMTVEWTNTPDPAATAFKLEWFQGDGMVRRKNLPNEYNA
uniref:Major sperm protein n=1 Tax=Globodera rostochiensis TaxID=31243 RepID=A0A914IBV7_GLORO